MAKKEKESGISIEALAWEARRRGVRYGELVASLTVDHEIEIDARYKKWKRERAKEIREAMKERAARK